MFKPTKNFLTLKSRQKMVNCQNGCRDKTWQVSSEEREYNILLIWVMSNNEETFMKKKDGSALSFKGWAGFGLAERREKGFTDKGILRINAKGHY